MTPILPSGDFSGSPDQQPCHPALQGLKVCWSMGAAAPMRRRGSPTLPEPGAGVAAGSGAPAWASERDAAAPSQRVSWLPTDDHAFVFL